MVPSPVCWLLALVLQGAARSSHSPTWLLAVQTPLHGLMDWNQPVAVPDATPHGTETWTLSLLPALLSPRLPGFQDWFKGNGLGKPREVIPHK